MRVRIDGGSKGFQRHDERNSGQKFTISGKNREGPWMKRSERLWGFLERGKTKFVQPSISNSDHVPLLLRPAFLAQHTVRRLAPGINDTESFWNKCTPSHHETAFFCDRNRDSFLGHTKSDRGSPAPQMSPRTRYCYSQVCLHAPE